jgi:hypothetical protein
VLQGAPAARATATIHTGIFELPVARPDTPLRVEVSARGESVRRTLWPLPTEITADAGSPFNVLLMSCFHRLEDKGGKAGDALSRLKIRPHLSVFAGDQVYLDLPTLKNFEDDLGWLANRFQEDYRANWFGVASAPGGTDGVGAGFPQMLALAPSAFLPDDHEFWNNYPAASAPVENSWTSPGRERWTRAAEAGIKGFQQCAACEFGEARTIVIEPLSILLLDTRSRRAKASRNNDGDLLGAAGRLALARWVDGLLDRTDKNNFAFGMLVTGQSLFSPAAGDIKGTVADFEFPDYPADYAFMVAQIERMSERGLPVLLATGDVHYGRALRADQSAMPGRMIFEIISSPTSLVSTVFLDQAKEVWGSVRSRFGNRDPWPRHSDAAMPPPRFGSAMQYTTSLLARTDGRPATMRGDQAFMLRFHRAGAGLDVEVVCLPLAADDGFNAVERWSTLIRLRPPRTI